MVVTTLLLGQLTLIVFFTSKLKRKQALGADELFLATLIMIIATKVPAAVSTCPLPAVAGGATQSQTFFFRARGTGIKTAGTRRTLAFLWKLIMNSAATFIMATSPPINTSGAV